MIIKYIEWVDSHLHNGTWVDIDELKESEFKLPIMKTIGFVVFEDDEQITISSSISEKSDSNYSQATAIITIPKSAIRKISAIQP